MQRLFSALHNKFIQCPKCQSTQVRKNGARSGRQAYICKHCSRQFLESYLPQGYSDEIKQLCLKMYVNGMGFRAIERVTDINSLHYYQLGKTDGKFCAVWRLKCRRFLKLPLLAELQTFVQSKKNKVWLWIVVNHWHPGILAWIVGDAPRGFAREGSQRLNVPVLVVANTDLGLLLVCH